MNRFNMNHIHLPQAGCSCRSCFDSQCFVPPAPKDAFRRADFTPGPPYHMQQREANLEEAYRQLAKPGPGAIHNAVAWPEQFPIRCTLVVCSGPTGSHPMPGLPRDALLLTSPAGLGLQQRTTEASGGIEEFVPATDASTMLTQEPYSDTVSLPPVPSNIATRDGKRQNPVLGWRKECPTNGPVEEHGQPVAVVARCVNVAFSPPFDDGRCHKTQRDEDSKYLEARYASKPGTKAASPIKQSKLLHEQSLSSNATIQHAASSEPPSFQAPPDFPLQDCGEFETGNSPKNEDIGNNIRRVAPYSGDLAGEYASLKQAVKCRVGARLGNNLMDPESAKMALFILERLEEGMSWDTVWSEYVAQCKPVSNTQALKQRFYRLKRDNHVLEQLYDRRKPRRAVQRRRRMRSDRRDTPDRLPTDTPWRGSVLQYLREMLFNWRLP